jgi:hypothetical protein
MLSAGGRQMIRFDRAGTRTGPTNTTVIVGGRKLDFFICYGSVSVIFILYFDDVVFDRNVLSVFAHDVMLMT